jgi:hypothetical protein
MLKKYVSKFAMDILPSVAATIIGAYIVNHYIVTKPAASTPAVAAVSTAEPQAGAKVAPEAAKAGSQPPETSSDVANIPEAGVKAKGISEKAMIEKTAAEKPAAVEKPGRKQPTKRRNPLTSRRRPQALPRERAITRRHRAKRRSPRLFRHRCSLRYPSSPRRVLSLRRQLRLQWPRKSIATPTISRVRPSSACVARTSLRRVRKKPLASRMRPGCRMGLASRTRLVSRRRHRSGRFRRRS